MRRSTDTDARPSPLPGVARRLMTADDVLFRFPVRALALAAEMGSLRAACRATGIHPSTLYRWRRQAERLEFDIFRPRAPRPSRLPACPSGTGAKCVA